MAIPSIDVSPGQLSKSIAQGAARLVDTLLIPAEGPEGVSDSGSESEIDAHELIV